MTKDQLDFWVAAAAVWGAATGTLALLVQVRQHFSDRPKLEARARMAIRSNGFSGPGIAFELDLVNRGRRICRIEKAAITLPLVPSDDAVGQAAQAAGCKLVNSETILFDAGADEPIELAADGGKVCLGGDGFERVASILKGAGRRRAKAYVRLTTGKAIWVTFVPVDPANLTRLRDSSQASGGIQPGCGRVKK